MSLDNFYISIVCIKSYDISLNQLLDTIPSHFKIIIVYQNEPEESYCINDKGHIIVNIKNNIFEFGNWIGLKILFNNKVIPDDAKILLLHSTSKFRSDPTEEITKRLEEMKDSNIYYMAKYGNCNIAIIDKMGIDTGYELYKNYLTMDKSTAIEWEWNHNLNESPKSWKNLKQQFSKYTANVEGYKAIYSNVVRVILTFNSLNLEKYHAKDNIKDAYNV